MQRTICLIKVTLHFTNTIPIGRTRTQKPQNTWQRGVNVNGGFGRAVRRLNTAQRGAPLAGQKSAHSLFLLPNVYTMISVHARWGREKTPCSFQCL